ncbi:MAG: HigA family addiction module antitoxin [bacterium]
MAERKYNPDIAIHPGKTLEDTLNSLKMSQADLAHRTGLTTKTINEIIQGKNPITPDTAIKLSMVFGMSANFWNNLEKNYEETLARLSFEKQVAKELPLLQKFTCYNELYKWGYVKKTLDAKEKINNLLSFFGITSLNLVPVNLGVSFRRTKGKQVSNESLAAWLRCGEIDAQEIKTQDFDKSKLINSLESLKSLTKEKPEVFQSKLIDICSSSGIAVAFVPPLKKTYVNGATRWINPDKAIIQLSLRGNRDDIFWFTFFHEIAHLVKHSKKEQFIEFEDQKSTEDKEKEADEFACETLIPEKKYLSFISKKDTSDNAIMNFANELNISASIVAGRLCHKHNDWKKWSHLRKRLKFVSSTSC